MAILKIPAKRSKVKPRPSDFGDPLEIPKPELDPKLAAAAAVGAFLCAYGEQEDGRAAAGGGSRR